MANNNDLKVLELKKQIENKKKAMGEYRKFAPRTTCVLELDEIKYNLHTLIKENLIHLLVKLNCYRDMADNMSITKDYVISGFNINDWICDVGGKLTDINYKEEIKKLNAMELKLDKLLSDEKKVELELDDIANYLK